ncbi:MAG: FHA domain-containing protein [Planctomycetota bacterium]
MGSRIFIYHVSGAKQGEIEVCTSNVVRMGRQPGCEIQVDPYADLYASGHHAQITWVGGEQFTLADTGSKLGTFKNDVRVVDPVPLTTGDVITLGRDRQGRTGPQLRFYLDRDILKCPGCQDPVYKRHFTCPTCQQRFCLRCIDFRQRVCKPCGQRPASAPAPQHGFPPPPGHDPFGPPPVAASVGSQSEPELRVPDLHLYTSAAPTAPPGVRPPDASGSGRMNASSSRLAQAAAEALARSDSQRLERSGSGRMASSGSNAFPRPNAPAPPGGQQGQGGYVPTISSTARPPQAPTPPRRPDEEETVPIFSDSVEGPIEAEAPKAIPCERCSAPLSAADFFVCIGCHKRLCSRHRQTEDECDRCHSPEQGLLETDDNPPPAWVGPRPPSPPSAPIAPGPTHSVPTAPIARPAAVAEESELSGVEFECPGCGIAVSPKASTCPGCWRKLK